MTIHLRKTATDHCCDIHRVGALGITSLPVIKNAPLLYFMEGKDMKAKSDNIVWVIDHRQGTGFVSISIFTKKKYATEFIKTNYPNSGITSTRMSLGTAIRLAMMFYLAIYIDDVEIDVANQVDMIAERILNIRDYYSQG